jgi:LuxR family maltose regulon positive regulatory protein
MVSRGRLTRLLSAEPAASIVLVVAPPGYGKTVLLADWAADQQREVAWLTLGEFDNDPSVFLTYVAAAIDRVEPIDPSLGRALTAQGTRILAEAVPRLASELHRWRRPGVLVLDDVHRLEDRTCLDALASLLGHLPPGFRVVMASRTMPDLPVGRLRANRALLEIRKDDLAFDAPEAEALAAAAGLRLSRDQARALVERTEGWAAAIYLAALAHERDGAHAIGAGEVSGRGGYVAEYLRSELEPMLDDRDVTLLTRTSIVDVLEPGLAEIVSALPDATDRLRRLAQANLLIGEVPGEAPSYRYHHLLRDYLEAELERREPGARAELHRRASSWYLDAGRPELAIEHSIASGDTDAAAILVEGATLRTYMLGHGDRLSRWFQAFDDEAFTRRPTLAVGAAIVYALSGRPDAADRMADIVERSTFDGVPANGSASFESARSMLRAIMVRRGAADAFRHASAAVEAEASGSPWRTLALEALAQAHLMLGDAAAADMALAEAVDSAPPGGSYAFYALALRASIAMGRGDWERAAADARESHRRIERMQLGAAASATLVHAVAARVAIHHGDLVHGREELVHAQLVRPLASHSLPPTMVAALLEVARAYLSIADPAGAGSAVAEAERILDRRPDLGALAEQLAEIRGRVHGASQALPLPSTLTPAELRVLPMLSTHLMFQEIAERLHVSKHTVKAQVVSIYGKLGVSSRGEAVDRAIEIGLLEPFPGLRFAGRPRRD